MWEFCTEPEFQEKLDWMTAFVRDECEPLDLLFPRPGDPYDVQNKASRAILAKLLRWYPPPELLKMATADNGALMALSGFINPYPGKLGVVEEGAIADLLLVDGNPLDDIKLVADPDRKFLVIMKGGTIYKDILAN